VGTVGYALFPPLNLSIAWHRVGARWRMIGQGMAGALSLHLEAVVLGVGLMAFAVSFPFIGL
jgi:hypothetical protein